MKNTINWFEIPVTQIDKSAALYAKALGLDLKRGEFGGRIHAILPADDEAGVTGALVQSAKVEPARNGVVIYLHAGDGVAKCLARAVEAGAKVVQPRTDIGPHGESGQFADLDGNVIGLHSPVAKP